MIDQKYYNTGRKNFSTFYKIWNVEKSLETFEQNLLCYHNHTLGKKNLTRVFNIFYGQLNYKGE